MNLEKAIEALRGLIEPQSYTLGSYDKEAVDTVLNELENRYKKGQREGWKCGFNYAIQQKEYKNDRTIKIKNEYLRVMYLLLLDYDGCKSPERLKELIDETTEYIKKAIKNDDKSVITVNSKKKFNILGEEVEE